MRHLHTITSESTNPYENIALEEYLLMHTEPDECTLYLWQNQKTVVIGYNQNGWKECRIEELEAEGGHLARRLSGGGAVFHDLGNLNFTFLVRKDGYDLNQQTEVLLKAVQSFGIPAIRTGRNDSSVEGRKFSGNAFYRTGDYCYHHGTILIHADKKQMSRYLNVSREKLQSKGVDSVRSRVANLTEYVPDLTVERMKQALIESFSMVYGLPVTPFERGRIVQKDLAKRQERFASKDWLYGRKISFNLERSKRFDWGEILVQLDIVAGKIKDIRIWTDALDIDLPEQVTQALQGQWFRAAEIQQAVGNMVYKTEEQKRMIQEIATCLTEEESHGASI